MHYSEVFPAEVLQPFVDTVWSLSTAGDVAPPNAGMVYPDGRVELVIPLADGLETRGGSVRDPVIIGPFASWTLVKYCGVTEIIGARFSAAGAAAILRENVSQLAGTMVRLRDVRPVLADEIARLLWLEQSPKARVQAVETAIARCIGKTTTVDARISLAARECDRTPLSGPRNRTIRDIARVASLSPRQLERHFARTIGLTPKLYSRIRRFHSVSQAVLESTSMPKWTRIAYAAGYHDQAHLVKDFQEFAGESPARFWRMYREHDDAFLQDGRSLDL